MASRKKISSARGTVTTFYALIATALLAALPVVSPQSRLALAAPQAALSCIEDFSSDTDPTMPGFAGSVFSHSTSGNSVLGSGFPGGPPGHALALFAGATDTITFPTQTVTFARLQIFAFGPGMIIFEGVGDMLTTRFGPAPVAQTREATATTLGDNDQQLGRIVKITLIGFETLFDNIEISPCASTPPSSTVDVLVRTEAINPGRNDGVMKAVILSNAGFDATTVDPATVRFGAATVPFRYFFGDEDEDGDTDLIFFFLVGEVGIRCGDTTIPLRGQTTGGQLIEGEGHIKTVACH
jgi:hypothetical protein